MCNFNLTVRILQKVFEQREIHLTLQQHFSAFLLRTGIFRLLLRFRPPLDRTEILSAGSFLVVIQFDRSDCFKSHWNSDIYAMYGNCSL